MKTNYSISIPKPCHEDWSKMTPNEKGRFCQSCSKTVVDFTKMNTKEIQDYIHSNKNQRICGHIKQSQLNAINLKIPESVFNQTWNFHKLFLLALLLAMGTTLLNCSGSDGKKQKIDSIEVVKTHQKSIDTILNKEETKKVKQDSTVKKELIAQKPKVKEQHIIEGLMIVGDIEVEPVKIDSLEIVTPSSCPSPQIDDAFIGFINITNPPEFFDMPKNISQAEKADYFSKRINKIVSENFNLGQSYLGLKGKQRINTQFTIDKNGEIIKVKIRAPHPLLEKEARRVIELLPKFKPGQQRSQTVDVVYTLPIVFVAED